MRFVTLWLIAIVAITNITFGNPPPRSAPDVNVSVDRKYQGDGVFVFKIVERGEGPNGKYTRHYSFKARVKDGLALSSEFHDYKSTLSTARAGGWETQRQPVAGYCLIFDRDGRLCVDIELVELVDRHPLALSANGIHRLQELQ